MKIGLGQTSEGHVIHLDIDALLSTRLLLEANSGSGKSWVLRRLAEQMFGKVQVVIIDPEGEFASLREKYGYVLVGKGGETPADTRSAALVAHKLLELNASAVCDVFEMKDADRKRWVRLFVDAMIDSPKNLWHPVVVVVDEASMFSPERGDSEAAESMISLATRGRKRGFASVFACQRLGNLSKNVAAQCTNVMIGGTSMDIDLKRAAEAMGVLPHDQRDFFQKLKMLEPGNFYVLGRAISKEMICMKAGPVETTHPDISSRKHQASEPPPPPEKVKLLLPKLADLPREAEQKAKTESELRQEIRNLRTELANVKPVSDPVVMDRAVEKATAGLNAHLRQARSLLAQAIADFKKIASISVAFANESEKSIEDLGGTVEAIQKSGGPLRVPVEITRRPIRKVAVAGCSNGDLTGPEQRILNAIAWMNSIGVDSPEQTAVAFLAGYTIGGGAWGNPRGALKTKGLVEYDGGRIRMTADGRAAAQQPETPLTTEELHRKIMERLPGPETKLFRALVEAGPEGLTNEELAERTGYAVSGGGYGNPRGRLKTLGLIEYRNGRVVPRDILFLD